ncbi:MAG: hypothetical protein JWO86_1778 [Myxococcaceae bacterium]|nr:hypothetical protein [Myxococcaceae bacterium]
MSLSRSILALSSLVLLAGLAGCTIGTPGADTTDPSTSAQPAPVQGGAVAANDRTDTAKSGEKLLTGDMIVSPAGGYAVLQRNSVSVVVDAALGTARELPFQVDRFVFASGSATGYAINPGNAVVAFDLATLNILWSTSLPTNDVVLFRVSPDDRSLIVALGERVVALDTVTGLLHGDVALTSRPTYLAFAGSSRAVVVGSTRWTDHEPATSLTSLDLAAGTVVSAAASIDVPNCEAPLTMLPDGTRGFLSPTYCEETVPANVQKTWTNPDPVSVIDVGGAANGGLAFVKNLPGFGPVALNGRADKVIAYLDATRIDPAMFDDKSQIPAKDADPYHLLAIDPHTLKLSLYPIGRELPRFAMSIDGRGLLVDASVHVFRAEAKVSVTVGPDGVTASASGVFGSDAPFGYFDFDAARFTAFDGPQVGLDRFVQTVDGHVYALKTRSDGLGGDLFGVDVTHHATADLGLSLRDIGVLADRRTLLLRIRLPAASINGQLFTQEQVCFSTDGRNCTSTIQYRSSTPLPGATPESCTGHDC